MVGEVAEMAYFEALVGRADGGAFDAAGPWPSLPEAAELAIVGLGDLDAEHGSVRRLRPRMTMPAGRAFPSR